MEEHPIVFISYSHDSDEHKEWVKSLATRWRRRYFRPMGFTYRTRFKIFHGTGSYKI